MTKSIPQAKERMDLNPSPGKLMESLGQFAPQHRRVGLSSRFTESLLYRRAAPTMPASPAGEN